MRSPRLSGIIPFRNLCFAFDNLHRPGAEMFTGDGEERQAIADQFSSAIIAFAHNDAPGWGRYDAADRLTQRIGPEPELVVDPESALRDLWERRSGLVERNSVLS